MFAYTYTTFKLSSDNEFQSIVWIKFLCKYYNNVISFRIARDVHIRMNLSVFPN